MSSPRLRSIRGLAWIALAALVVGACSSGDEQPAAEAPSAVSDTAAEEPSATSDVTATDAAEVMFVEPEPWILGPTEGDPFCRALGELQRGEVGLGGGTFLERTVVSVDHLLAAAPASIEADLQLLRDIVFGLSTAGAETNALAAFALATTNELPVAEQRIADTISALCDYDPPAHPDVPPPIPLDGVEPFDIANSACASWPRFGNIQSNNVFPYLFDGTGTGYWSLNYTVEPGGWIELHGEYPDTRFFALHPNDQDTNNLPSLRDVDIVPDDGSGNPFLAELEEGQPKDWTVVARFEPPPSEAEPNTIYLGETKNGQPNTRGVLLYRLYGVTDTSTLDGGVDLPSVTVHDADGEIVERYERCDGYPEGYEPPTGLPLFPSLLIPDSRATNPPSIDASRSWDAPVDILANQDAVYWGSNYSSAFGDLFVLRAKAPRSPDTRGGEAVWEVPDADLRYITVCNYNFWAGRPNTCALENELAVDDEGRYTIVVTTPENRPEGATADHGVTWFDWGPFLDGTISFRAGLRGDPFAAALETALTGGEVAPEVEPFLPDATYCDPSVFDAGGAGACFAS